MKIIVKNVVAAASTVFWGAVGVSNIKVQAGSFFGKVLGSVYLRLFRALFPPPSNFFGFFLKVNGLCVLVRGLAGCHMGEHHVDGAPRPGHHADLGKKERIKLRRKFIYIPG